MQTAKANAIPSPPTAATLPSADMQAELAQQVTDLRTEALDGVDRLEKVVETLVTEQKGTTFPLLEARLAARFKGFYFIAIVAAVGAIQVVVASTELGCLHVQHLHKIPR